MSEKEENTTRPTSLMDLYHIISSVNQPILTNADAYSSVNAMTRQLIRSCQCIQVLKRKTK